jgi:REP element-mobilizing transposase RayT
MSELYQSLSHSRWTCKSHVGVVPKRRRQKLFGEIRRQLGPMFQELGSAGYLTLHSTAECTIQDLTFSPTRVGHSGSMR